MVLHEVKPQGLDNLLRVYKESPYKARVMFRNSSNQVFRIAYVKFEEEDGNFTYIKYRYKYGISDKNRIYQTRSKDSSIIYKDKKFWFMNDEQRRGKFSQLTYGQLDAFFPSPLREEIIAEFISKFSYIGVIREYPLLWGKALNTYQKNELWGYKDMLRHFFRVPVNIIKIYLERYNQQGISDFDTLKRQFERLKKYVDKIENLNREFLTDPHLDDMLQLAHKLDKKLNPNWGRKRMKEEHDIWSEELTEILMSLEEVKKLKIADVYQEFARISGYQLLRTNVEVIREGKKQHHCVGGYLPSIESGNCAIFHVRGFTLEVVKRNRYINYNMNGQKANREDENHLQMNQFKGLRNVDAPAELKDEVNQMILEFNKSLNPKNKMELCEDEEITQREDEVLELRG